MVKFQGCKDTEINNIWEAQSQQNGGGQVRAKREPAQQMALFSDGGKLQKLLQGLDISNLTPLEAINKLYELQKEAQYGG